MSQQKEFCYAILNVQSRLFEEFVVQFVILLDFLYHASPANFNNSKQTKDDAVGVTAEA